MNSSLFCEDLKDCIEGTVLDLLDIARFTLQQNSTHMPTAILHILDGYLPIVLPYETEDQKQALVQYVKEQVIQLHAFALTTISSAKVVNFRTGAKSECLVLATVMRGDAVHMVVQEFERDQDRGLIEFGRVIKGEDAEMPGQMIIFPEWAPEVYH